MRCPKCNKQPISLMHFALTSFPSNINCMSCDTKLKPGKLLQGWVYGEYLLGGILGFVLVIVAGANSWSLATSAVVFLVLVLVFGTPILLYAWKNGKYELIHKPA